MVNDAMQRHYLGDVMDVRFDIAVSQHEDRTDTCFDEYQYDLPDELPVQQRQRGRLLRRVGAVGLVLGQGKRG